MLAAQNLSLRRGGVRVLEGLDAALEPGAITAIVGPNGAGKSSLLLGLAGLLAPEQGRVSLDGRDLSGLPPRERARVLGYLPQGADIAWDVAVETLVALGRMPHGDARGAGREAIERAIAALSLEDLRHRPASRLSGGERARALLARVLAGSPRWILADEPLAALDLAHQLALVGHLRACAAAGQGVVVVLHDLALAMNHADRVMVLRGGRLVAAGPPEEALSSRTIADVWGVEARWLGEPGRRALAAV
ncbi:ABC transporter ATP-binding protein [Erythrobacter sp.]|uniref:ABC transporter ATP-binding protein n=1 Tax=Erythrobacter sp. TaxID=1042 RepID=UPI001425F26A|nr:ABC transporter ATP-binding protein [Erythrobacter sp.]QIQ85793.1 MAG: ABC transporter ATP-binding protein [Erythrobacter sp.]